MRIFGRSSVDKSKHIVEVSDEELEALKNIEKNKNEPDLFDLFSDEPYKKETPATSKDIENVQRTNIFNDVNSMNDLINLDDAFDENEPNVPSPSILVDKILDEYNDKKINKEQMKSLISAIKGK